MSSPPPEPDISFPPHGLRFGDALQFGWQMFKPNAGRWVRLLLVVALLFCTATLPVLWFTEDESSTALVSTDPLGIAGDLWIFFTFTLGSALLARAALLQSAGTPPSVIATLSILRRPVVWRYALVASIPSELLELVNVGLSALLGVVGYFVTIIIVADNVGVWAAFMRALELVRHNIASSLVMYFGSGIFVAVSFLMLGVGILAGIPTAFLAYVYAYRVLTSLESAGSIAPS